MQGVHLEVHQLPGDVIRLRFYADASAAPEFLPEEVSGVMLALEEEGKPQFLILTIPLNAQGRGVLELAAPMVRGAMSLLGVALVTE